GARVAGRDGVASHPSRLKAMDPRRIVLAATAMWHLLAAWHFTLYPARTLARTTRERPVQPLATELFRFLGGLNAALVLLGAAAGAGSALTHPARAMRWSGPCPAPARCRHGSPPSRSRRGRS